LKSFFIAGLSFPFQSGALKSDENACLSKLKYNELLLQLYYLYTRKSEKES